jgi:uncharacterized membrane protein
MSNLLRRALKISITPAILMIAGKILGLLAINIIYDLSFQIDNEIQGIYSVQLYYSNPAVTTFANSISNLLMITVIAVPLFYFIIKTIFYQKSLENPRTIVKMTKFNVSKWITKNDSSFLSIFIWTCFLWLSSAVTIAHYLQGITYSYIAIIAGIMAILATWGAIKTFDSETAKIYPRDKKYI